MVSPKTRWCTAIRQLVTVVTVSMPRFASLSCMHTSLGSSCGKKTTRFFRFCCTPCLCTAGTFGHFSTFNFTFFPSHLSWKDDRNCPELLFGVSLSLTKTFMIQKRVRTGQRRSVSRKNRDSKEDVEGQKSNVEKKGFIWCSNWITIVSSVSSLRNIFPDLCKERDSRGEP